MASLIAEYRDKKDSIGGTVTCVIRNVPVGLGEPCFDKLEAKLAHAMLSIPATKGFEIGSGFRGTEVPGSIHNDAFTRSADGRLSTITNNSGGIQGGISNGENIYFKVAFKSPATIGHAQNTSKYNGEAGVLAAKGRHDPCVVPRAVPIVEAMAALVIMDAALTQQVRIYSTFPRHDSNYIDGCTLQAREASRTLLPALPSNIGIKTRTVVDGSEKKIDLSEVPEAENRKLVAGPNGDKIVGGFEGTAFGDE